MKKLVSAATIVLSFGLLDCGITKDPVVVQDFNQVIGCVVQNDSSLAAVLTNCAQYATAELIAAIEYALSDSAFTAAHPDDAAKLRTALPGLQVQLAAERAADANGKNSLP